MDAQNNIYAEDQGNFMIRKITPAGVVSTLAGNGSQGSSDGPASMATFNSLSGITIDKKGDLYITDNNLVRKVTSDGTVTTIAGDVTGTIGSGTDGVGIAASFLRPRGLLLM